MISEFMMTEIKGYHSDSMSDMHSCIFIYVFLLYKRQLSRYYMKNMMCNQYKKEIYSTSRQYTLPFPELCLARPFS